MEGFVMRDKYFGSTIKGLTAQDKGKQILVVKEGNENEFKGDNRFACVFGIYKGFTLIELMVVVIVVGVAASASIVGYNKVMKQQRYKRVEINLLGIRSAAEIHHSKTGSYRLHPTLNAFVIDPRWQVDTIREYLKNCPIFDDPDFVYNYTTYGVPDPDYHSLYAQSRRETCSVDLQLDRKISYAGTGCP